MPGNATRLIGNRGSNDLDPQDVPGVRAGAGERLERVLRVAEVVVVRRRPHGERTGGVVVENELLPCLPGEVDDHVSPLRATQQQVAREGRGVERKIVRKCRLRQQEPGLVPDLDDRRARRIGGQVCETGLRVRRDSTGTGVAPACSRLMFRNRALQAFKASGNGTASPRRSEVDRPCRCTAWCLRRTRGHDGLGGVYPVLRTVQLRLIDMVIPQAARRLYSGVPRQTKWGLPGSCRFTKILSCKTSGIVRRGRQDLACP